MTLKFILLFFTLFFTFTFINIKLTIAARAIAFHEYEKFGESKTSFVLMILSVIGWSVYYTLY